jgi:hypothetical protein
MSSADGDSPAPAIEVAKRGKAMQAMAAVVSRNISGLASKDWGGRLRVRVEGGLWGWQYNRSTPIDESKIGRKRDEA